MTRKIFSVYGCLKEDVPEADLLQIEAEVDQFMIETAWITEDS